SYCFCYAILRTSLRSTLFPYTTLFRSIDNFEPIQSMVTRVAEKHRALNVKPEQYPVVGTALIDAVKKVLGEAATINAVPTTGYRSEEHTSELQSRFDLVCRLLLEKKNH